MLKATLLLLQECCGLCNTLLAAMRADSDGIVPLRLKAERLHGSAGGTFFPACTLTHTLKKHKNIDSVLFFRTEIAIFVPKKRTLWIKYILNRK